MNLADALEHHARARPDHVALEQGERVIAHGEMRDLVRRSATHLLTLGLAPGDVVGVALRDHLDHLVIMYALARAGLAMLPMDWRWSRGEKERVAIHFGAKLALIEAGETIADTRCLAVDTAWHDAVAQASLDRDFSSCAEDALLLSLSSGTTGRPKGPMITHGQLLGRFWTHWINLGLNSRDRYLSATPVYFGGGRSFCMSVLFSGGTVIQFPPPWEPESLVAEVERRRATSMFLVPTMLRRLLALPDRTLTGLKPLRLLISSGSALEPEERRAIRERLCANFCEYYASTEGGGISLTTPADQDRCPSSVGRAIFGVEIEIVDDAHRPVPHGQEGHLRYRGPGCATGFHRDPESSSEAFRDGWFYPGDLACLDEAGYVFLRGRAKDMIIRGGINIHPAEIEAVLVSHPDIAEAAVLGVPSPERGEEVAAFVCLRTDRSDEEILGWCRSRLAPYKVPAVLRRIGEMPRNSAGKVIKSELARLLQPDPPRAKPLE